MFDFFKRDPKKKLKKEIASKLEIARDIQRSGDIKAYAIMMGEIDKLQKQLNDM